MAALSTQKVVATGLTPAFSAAAGGGDTCQPGDNNFLYVKNGGGSPINVTIAAYPSTSDWGATIPDLVVAVTNGQERMIGPLRGAYFANPTTGVVDITYSGVTTVTVGCFQVA